MWQQYNELMLRFKPDSGGVRGGNRGIFIVEASTGVLVGAMTISDSDGPYILYEEFLLNHDYPRDVRYLATDMLAQAMVQDSVLAGKVAVGHPSFRRGVEVLEKYGFVRVPAAVMVRSPLPCPVGWGVALGSAEGGGPSDEAQQQAGDRALERAGEVPPDDAPGSDEDSSEQDSSGSDHPDEAEPDEDPDGGEGDGGLKHVTPPILKLRRPIQRSRLDGAPRK